MRHLKAIQPPHLDGLWQFASLGRRGGGPVCGCEVNSGHKTEAEAVAHYYKTHLDRLTMKNIHKSDSAMRCRVEKCVEWTPFFILGDFYGPYGMEPVYRCADHLPGNEKELRKLMHDLNPPRLGQEFFVQ